MKSIAPLVASLLLLTAPARSQGTVTLDSKDLTVNLDPATMSVDVRHKSARADWRMSRDGAREFVYEQDGKIHEVSLADSKDKRVSVLGKTACSVTLADFRFELLVWIDEEKNDVVFKLIPLEEDHQFKIKGVIYPRPFDIPLQSDAYSFFPFAQGILIPGNWAEAEEINNPLRFGSESRIELWGELMNRPSHWWDWQDGDQSGLVSHAKMACFGGVQPRSGFLAIIADNCQMDTHLRVRHTPGKPTRYEVLWRPTMGEFGYPRTIGYHFERDAGYVRLIKYYREYYRKLGYLTTLEEKNRRNPDVEKLKGAINLGTRVSRHDRRTFTHEVYNTFHDIGEQVADFKNKLGVDRAAISFTGWQRYGHDQEYPDIMPPMMYAGGPLGLDSLSTRVQEMGYLFGLATDNYCDITLDAASFDEEVTLKDSQGKYFRRSTWGAGVNTLICPRWGLRFLRRNFEVGRTDYPPVLGLLETAHPDMYLLGNYVCNWECYDPRHPLTRNENREALKDIFQYFTDKGILFSIEHHIDWAVPYIMRARTRSDHDGVYGQDAEGRRRAVPLPLWQLVFHDCTYVSGDNYLYAVLWGGVASLGLPVSDDRQRIDDTLRLAKLHRAVGWDEMTDHKFLSADYQVQETAFSSGVKVWVDLNKRQYKITGVDGIEPTVREAPAFRTR